jgi:MFS family permease
MRSGGGVWGTSAPQGGAYSISQHPSDLVENATLTSAIDSNLVSYGSIREEQEYHHLRGKEEEEEKKETYLGVGGGWQGSLPGLDPSFHHDDDGEFGGKGKEVKGEYQGMINGIDNKDDHKGDLSEGKSTRWYVPRRYILSFLAFLGFVNVYALRTVLSVAIVPMQKQYHWNSTDKGVVLAAFFAGYMATQLIGGWVAIRYGGKWVLGLGIFGTGALTLVTPVAADLSIWAVVAVRVFEGIGEGVTYPAMHALFATWAPAQERSRMSGIVYSGAFVGTVISLPTSSLLASSSFLGGWPSVFYIYGGVAVFWLIPWIIFVSNSPMVHPTISPQEREYITSTLPPETKPSLREVPWMKIFLCLPFWAILINNTCNNWAFYTLLTWMPTYLKDVLNFDLQNAGGIAVLPYLCLTFTWTISGFVADWLIAHWLSVTAVRKIFQTLGFAISAAALVGCGYASSSVPLAVALMTISVAGGGLVSSGFMVNHLDIAPNYAGILMGLANTAGTLPGIISPVLTGLILGNDEQSVVRWQIVFYISAGTYAFGILVWLIFASGKRQI